MKKRASILLVLTAIITGVIGYPINSVTAESTTEELPLTASANDLAYGVLTPGNSYTKTLTLTNQSDNEVAFSLAIENYAAIDPASGHAGIAEWITLNGATDYTLAAGADTNISLRTRVPKDATAGGQYAVLIATDPLGHNALALTVISAIIDGDDLKYGGEIVASDISWFNLTPEIKSSATVKNIGNADFKSASKLTVRSIFGGDPIFEDATTTVNYPGAANADFHNDWTAAPAIGLYNAAQTITYVNANGEIVEHTTERIVIMCPVWLLIALGIIILAAIALIVILKIRRKSSLNPPKSPKQDKISHKNHKKPSWEQEQPEEEHQEQQTPLT